MLARRGHGGLGLGRGGGCSLCFLQRRGADKRTTPRRFFAPTSFELRDGRRRQRDGLLPPGAGAEAAPGDEGRLAWRWVAMGGDGWRTTATRCCTPRRRC